MAGLMAPVLAGGVKGFLENPELLLGVPLLLLGIFGLLLVLTPFELRWPQRSEPAPEPEILPPPAGHPTAAVYVQVGVILGVITAIEVAIYYVNVAQGILLGLLLALSAVKFVVVAMWFMHLRFDNRMFSVFFSGAIMLAVALLTVVLATLGATLV